MIFLGTYETETKEFSRIKGKEDINKFVERYNPVFEYWLNKYKDQYKWKLLGLFNEYHLFINPELNPKRKRR